MKAQFSDFPLLKKDEVDNVMQGFGNTHAILLHGSAGIGKNHLATIVARRLLTQSETSQDLELFNAGTHPDLHILTCAFNYSNLNSKLQLHSLRYLDSDSLGKKRLSRQIGIESIRSLVENLGKASALGGYKLVILYPAEALNINASNALLKFLEEPTDETLFLLVSHDISRLSATIRSRCMSINLALPEINQSYRWLKTCHNGKTEMEIRNALRLAGNRPLKAYAYLESDHQTLVEDLLNDVDQIASNKINIISLARKWAGFKQTDFILEWLCKLFSDMIKFKLSPDLTTQYFNHLDFIKSVSAKITAHKLFELYDYISALNHRFDGVVDETLLIEDAMLTIQDAARMQ